MKRILLTLLAVILLLPLGAQENHRYGIKSGYMKTASIMGDYKSYNYLWFDNYGFHEKGVTEMNMGPELGVFLATTVFKGEEGWAINNDNQVKKMEGRPQVNWLTLTDAQMKEFKIKKIGEEVYKGYPCVVYEEERKQMLSKVKVTNWIYKGIIIRQHFKKKLTADTYIELEELQENAVIPTGTFDIPQE